MWKHFEELLPVIEHHLFWLMDGSVAIDKGVVVRHKASEAVQVLIADTLVELKCDEFRILSAHWQI